MGRNSVITREFCDAFCELLEEGKTITECCEEFGLDQPRYYAWRDKAEDGIEPFKSFIDRAEKIREEVPTKMPRRTKLTKELCDEICRYIEMGNYIDRSCEAVGINPSTFYTWKKKGKRGIEPYATFLKRVEKVEAKAEMKHLGIIHDVAEGGNWLASAWILERKYPNRFGKREQMALATDNDFKLEISTAKSPYEMGLEEKRLLEEDRKDE